MKRILTLMLALLMILPIMISGAIADDEQKILKVAGCNNLEDTTNPYSVLLIDFFEKFTQETGIDIEYETVVWDQIDSKLVVTNMAGAPSSDLTWCSSQKLASLMNSNALYPLDEFIERDLNENDYTSLMWNAVTYPVDKKKYMVLTSIHSRGIWYNTDLMPEAPKTWDELVEYGMEATDPDNNQWGFGCYLIPQYGSMEVTVGPFIWAAGGSISTVEGAGCWNEPEAVEGIQFLADLFHKFKIASPACYEADFSGIEEGFRTGSVASVINGTYAVSSYMDTDLARDGKIKFAPIPGKDGPAPNFSNGWALGIPSNCPEDKLEMAWELMKFWSRADNQAEHSKVEGGLPTAIASYENEAFLVEPFISFFNNLPNGRSMDPLVHYQEGLEAAILSIHQYLFDPSIDLQAALDEGVENFNAEFGY